MACCATTRPALSLHSSLSQPSNHPSPSLRRPRIRFCDKALTIPGLPPALTTPVSYSRLKAPAITPRSALEPVDVSSDDQFVSDDRSLSSDPREPQKVGERRMEEEKFAILNTGVFECRSCGFRYNRAVGDPSYPIPAGMEFEKLPEDWRCPTCGAAKSFFEGKSVEIAGFAQNQQFGLGGNALTSGQKTLLIYGSLSLFFVLLLCGYFLQ